MRTKQRHALIVAHPRSESFAMAVADAYRSSVEALGHSLVVRDLYRLDFQPCLQSDEIPRADGFAPATDIVAERAVIGDADVFCFVYPVWFYSPPAILEGYIQRVFGMGFGYSQRPGEGGRRLLGRSMISFSSSGSAAEWMRKEGSFDALQNLFDDHVAEVCGMTVLAHRHYGRVLPGTPSVQIEARLRDVRETVEKCFAAKS